MHVIATAGHVDHGKSTLVRALTGRDPDRWAEERRRGMTIDLGFVWTGLPSGETVAFVDVPGHQRFIANMLAGVGPVPAALFVVAADEGWARQSGEHLAALDALGVSHGLLAVTRSDLADPAPAMAEALDHLAASSLGRVEAVAVSGATGAGLDELRAALDRLVASLPRPEVDGRVRLWIDRAFTIRGSGTVVTGTLASGTIATGDEYAVHPGGARVRVRGLQSLERPADRISAVARVAVNLRGTDVDDVRRGHLLLTPGAWHVTDTVDVRLAGAPDELPESLILHIGAAAVTAHVRPLGADDVRLRLDTPLPLTLGDRAILRDPGRQRVAAGAVVLDADPPPLTRRGAAAARADDLRRMTATPDVVDELRRRGVVRRAHLVALGALRPGEGVPPAVISVGEYLVDAGLWRRWQEALRSVVAERAEAFPMAPASSREAVRHALRLPDAALVDALASATPGVVVGADGVQPAGATRQFPPPVQRAFDELAARLAAEPFAAPETPDLARLGLTDRHLAAGVKAGVLLRVADGIYLLPSADDEAVRRLRELGRPFTMSEARQALGTTRRVAVPLLERLDRLGLTRRVDSSTREVVGP